MGKCTQSSKNFMDLDRIPQGLHGDDACRHYDSEDDYRNLETPGGNKLIIENNIETEEIISKNLEMLMK